MGSGDWVQVLLLAKKKTTLQTEQPYQFTNPTSYNSSLKTPLCHCIPLCVWTWWTWTCWRIPTLWRQPLGTDGKQCLELLISPTAQVEGLGYVFYTVRMSFTCLHGSLFDIMCLLIAFLYCSYLLIVLPKWTIWVSDSTSVLWRNNQSRHICQAAAFVQFTPWLDSGRSTIKKQKGNEV